MAVITISRQVAALGDEIAETLAKNLGYKFFTRKDIEKRIVELGFPENKLEKYDERKPGFFASLAKGRDEYLNYLQYAIIEAANKGDCILIGRGAFAILENVPNVISVRFVAPDDKRLARLMAEFSWDEKKAQARITESAENRRGFHKSFFNIDNENPQHYLLTMNTGILTIEDSAKMIETITKSYVTEEKEAKGKAKIAGMLKCQELTNKLLFDYNLNISFLRATQDAEGKTITIHGVADSQAIVERAMQLSVKLVPECEIKSTISIVQDFKSYS